MTLKKLLCGISYMVIKGDKDLEISNITYDSEDVQAGDLFICVKGTKFDGHNYIDEAIKKGAVAIVIDRPVSSYHTDDNITVIMVADTRRALANISANYFGNPAKLCTVIGITGTKGKTTTSNMIKNILEYNHRRVGLIGTNGAKVGEAVLEIDNTTPLSYQIHKLLRFMVDQGCDYVIMEVSSQGLKMARVEGITFDYAIFTNISFDHVGENEHKSIEEYKYWKSRLFMQTKVGIINGNMPEIRNIIKDSTCKLYSYGMEMDEKSLQNLVVNIISDTEAKNQEQNLIKTEQESKNRETKFANAEEAKNQEQNLVKTEQESKNQGEKSTIAERNYKNLNQDSNKIVNIDSDEQFLGTDSVYATDIRLIKSESYLGSECTIYDSIIKAVYPIKITVAGVFNIYNALAAITCCSLIFDASQEKYKGEHRERSDDLQISGVKNNHIYDKKAVNLYTNNSGSVCNSILADVKNRDLYITRLEAAFRNFCVKGRVELVYGCDKFHIMIDYAHNEMSMKELLKTLRLYKPRRLVCLFGCGGNRSKLRRYSMGEIGGRYADFCILTEDNSRLEPPKQIIDDILIGMAKTAGDYIIIYDRKEAIKYAIENARAGDLIVLIGKGHEDYQDKNGVKTHFSEHEIVMQLVSKVCV